MQIQYYFLQGAWASPDLGCYICMLEPCPADTKGWPFRKSLAHGVRPSTGDSGIDADISGGRKWGTVLIFWSLSHFTSCELWGVRHSPDSYALDLSSILTPEVMTKPSPVMIRRAEVRFESHHPRFVKARMIWRELGTWRFQIVAKGEQEIIREKETEQQSPGCICHGNLIIKQPWIMFPSSAGPQEEMDTGFIWN